MSDLSINEYKPVMAIYDIRGKQDFIFRTNKLKEIAGGSRLIQHCFEEYLYPAAKFNGGKGIFTYKDEHGKDLNGEEFDFTSTRFKDHVEKDGYIGEVIYDGGGNFLLLFKNEYLFRETTYRFTKKLLEEVGTLKVLGTCVSIDGSFADYVKDRDLLYAEHRKNEMAECITAPWTALPISMIDRKTSFPYIYSNDQNEKLPKKLKKMAGQTSKESFAKLKAYYKEAERNPREIESVEQFDKMVTNKGEDSLLAVIYIDGNGMGAKVQDLLGAGGNYETCLKKLRDFSSNIQETYVDNGIKNALGFFGEKGDMDQGSIVKNRVIVSAGDEINFVVNAHDAMGCILRYFKGLPEGCSSCAGIAVFRSHAPYADAYRIAEECCESGKKKMKELNINNACFVDFHECQGAVGISLDRIRAEVGINYSLPWLVKIDENEKEKATDAKVPIYSGEVIEGSDIDILVDLFQKIGKSNVKGLAETAWKSGADMELELHRVEAHLTEEKKKETRKGWDYLRSIDDPERKRGLIYDVVGAYDMWFQGRGTSGNIDIEEEGVEENEGNA
ncbi:MAG: hypothetical protein K5989_07195 [Lachnospiraceae bacterium]|nr:hypothetical protein [Lachnospiraceae bacterium]